MNAVKNIDLSTRLIEKPVLKRKLSDFLVNESMMLSTQMTREDTDFCYFKLIKSGFTTFEAVENIARYFQFNPDCIQYAGLKDEDGITEQFIAIKSFLFPEQVRNFNQENRYSNDSFISLNFNGYGTEPIKIGGLNGNNFRIVIRNLSEKFVERIKLSKRYYFYFLNYYDTQRFGIKNHPKVTHLIGRSLVNKDYDTSLEFLKQSGTPESLIPIQYNQSSESFFKNLDNRIYAFYLSSYSSFIWNSKLAKLVENLCGEYVYRLSNESIDFVFTRKQENVLTLLNQNRELEFTKFVMEDGELVKSNSFRTTVIQTQLIFNAVEKDDLYEDAYKCNVSFFLPSGAYATMCIRQLVNMLDLI